MGKSKIEKPRVLILGKLPPPFIGPAIATEIILSSDLKNQFELWHFDTRLNTSVNEMGKFRFAKISALRKKYKAFAKVLNDFKPDILLIPIGQTTAGFFKDVPFIRMAAKQSKVLVQLRGSALRNWYEALDPLRKGAVKKELQKASGAIVLGDNLKYIFQGIIPDKQIFVVPNGANYHIPERKNKKLRLTYLANYLPGKGLLEVLKALRLLADDHDLPTFDFQAFGSWDNEAYRRECEKIMNAPGMEHCTLNEPVSGSEKFQVLADSDIFIFAANAPEGHPWSLVEATAAGLPIISTDRGAISQSVINGQNGFLLDHPNPEKLAVNIKMLIGDETLRAEMGKASRRIYEEGFTAGAMTDRMAAVFEEMVDVE
jgi:glycosyltransferase involved in cell wall biosynthesis